MQWYYVFPPDCGKSWTLASLGHCPGGQVGRAFEFCGVNLRQNIYQRVYRNHSKHQSTIALCDSSIITASKRSVRAGGRVYPECNTVYAVQITMHTSHIKVKSEKNERALLFLQNVSLIAFCFYAIIKCLYIINIVINSGYITNFNRIKSVLD